LGNCFAHRFAHLLTALLKLLIQLLAELLSEALNRFASDRLHLGESLQRGFFGLCGLWLLAELLQLVCTLARRLSQLLDALALRVVEVFRQQQVHQLLTLLVGQHNILL
jgi:hypothetical protein